MAMKEYRPAGGNVIIRNGKNGGKQFQHNEQTPSGMRRTIYDYPPPGTLDPKPSKG